MTLVELGVQSDSTCLAWTRAGQAIWAAKGAQGEGLAAVAPPYSCHNLEALEWRKGHAEGGSLNGKTCTMEKVLERRAVRTYFSISVLTYFETHFSP